MPAPKPQPSSGRSPAHSSATRLRPTLALFVAVAVLGLAGCVPGIGRDNATPLAPTPERQETGLLPATPRDGLAGDGDASAEAASAGDTSGQPAPTATPAPASLWCVPRRSQIAQLLLPLGTQQDLDQAMALASAGELGGLGLLGSPDAALAGLLGELQNASVVPVLIASDEEGGTVQRLADQLGPMPSAASAATTSSPDEVRASWLEYGSRVKALGIDVVFGPVVDVGSGPGIESRSFGDDPEVVVAFAGAVADGLSEAGVMPVFKHFPGHGRASGDSHLGLPISPSLDELRATDLVPYHQLVGSGIRDDAGVMVAHLTVPGLAEQVPTSLSPETINGLLKTEIGFGGLVFTDALNMGAITNQFDRAEATERAIIAGADIAILGAFSDVGPVIDHLVARVEDDPALAALLESRVRRVLAAKGQLEICVGAR